MVKQDKVDKTHSRASRLSRRAFLKVAAAGLVVGCQVVTKAPVAPTPSSSPTPENTPSPAPTQTATSMPPTPTPPATPTEVATVTQAPANTPASPTSIPTATPTLIPEGHTLPNPAGRVVQAQHTGVWSNEDLVPNALRQMLDASITELTGLNDAQEAWRALFDPGERIAIKVNSIRSSGHWTHAALVTAVTTRLQDIGVPAKQIVVFDRDTNELAAAGYTINTDSAGVRNYGTDNAYTGSWQVMDVDIKFSDILLNCDALINIPILKTHGTSGISFAMKNHYGTFDKPAHFHRPRIDQGMGELNALAPIRDRTRLIIGDALAICTRNWRDAVQDNRLLMSRDPVAHDTMGLSLYSQVTQDSGGNPAAAQNRAAPWLTHAAEIGLGINNEADINLVEVDLG